MNEINKLIESFYDGIISQSEELLLFNYFNSNDVLDEHLDEKELFLQIVQHDTTPIEVPSHLEANLNSLIDKLAAEETPKTSLRKHLRLWSGVAASVAIILSVGIYVNNLSIEEESNKIASKATHNSLTITDAEYIQAENAMRLLSYNFNKGMQQLDEMQENLDKTNRIFNETFKTN